MSTPTSPQITGPLAALLPLATAALVGWGIDDHTAGLAAGGVVMLLAAGVSWWKGRPAAMAQDLTKQGVTVQVGPTAPQELQDAAADRNVSGIEARVPPR